MAFLILFNYLNKKINFMKSNLLLISLLFLINNVSIAQKSWLGIPLFDKNIRLSDCPICESINNDKSLEAFEDSLYDNLPIQKWKDPEYFDKNHIFLNNLIPIYKNDTRKYNVILHVLFSLYLDKKLIDYDELNTKDLLEFSSFFDTLISLNPNSEIETYSHQRRMLEFQNVGALEKVEEFKSDKALNQQNVSWYFDDNLNGIQDKDWLGIAKIYVNDHKKSGPFHIYNGYEGLNLGYSSFGTRNGFYQGIDISLDNTTQVNPLMQGSRVSYFGVSFLKEYKGDNSEFLFYALQVRTFFHVNFVQFGINKNTNLGTKTWFWKPEIGLNFGLLNIAYAYNLPFKNTGDLKGHQLKIAFSYPLVRLGKYY